MSAILATFFLLAVANHKGEEPQSSMNVCLISYKMPSLLYFKCFLSAVYTSYCLN